MGSDLSVPYHCLSFTSITSYSKEPQQKYRIGTVSINILGGLKPVLQGLNLAFIFCHGSKHIVVRFA